MLSLGLALLLGAAPSSSFEAPAMAIRRLSAPVEIDGDLSDAGWKDALRIDAWYETRPADNATPKVRNLAWLAYDDRFFYAAFDFEDPEPGRIRAPVADRDNTSSDTDYGGIILDTRNDGRTAAMFLANPRGVQYDAVSDDATGNEDSSPDFFWEASGRITERGWSLEIRVPFSSLRYAKADPATWGVLLYRNWPREYRYQMFQTRLPRGNNCFICNSQKMTGLQGLPRGGGLVIAPYAAGSRRGAAAELGQPVEDGSAEGELGLDLKWSPTADTTLDGTVNPDFSQIESDVAQISANERFAVFYPEKRPFFLEGVDLFSSPLQAVYTRTVTAPRWGARGTGKLGPTAWTALLTEDEGGGSVIIPGPNGSEFAAQDFRSRAAIVRVKRDLGRSFVSLLASGRDPEGVGHNLVLGPDFQWRPRVGETVTGQLLFSDTRTPDRPDLASEWDGREMDGHALDLWWNHSRRTHDTWIEVRDVADGFRADNGFVPQVGYRDVFAEVGRTFWPEGGFRSRQRVFVYGNYSEDRSGRPLAQLVSVGTGVDGKWSSFARVRVAFDKVRAQERYLPRTQLHFDLQASPVPWLTGLRLWGYAGDEVDFAQARRGHGANVSFQAGSRPTDHLDLRLTLSRRWLDVDEGAESGRLFTAHVERLRATYNFTSRCYLRLIAQYVGDTRDPLLYADAVDERSGSLTASALFAYKLNWQTVLFAGYGDARALDDADDLQRSSREVFVKLSYAFQR